MRLDDNLIFKIDALLRGLSLNEIATSRKELTDFYRKNYKHNFKLSVNHQLAYLIARLPATYAVVCQVFEELKKRCPDLGLSTLLDIGAGPGTVLYAAMQASLPISSATLVEKEPGFIQLGKKLGHGGVEQHWLCQDVTRETNLSSHDLVVASYSLGELSENERMQVLIKLWQLTNKILIIIEPGTQVGFESLKKMREILLLHSGHLIAPCPHSEKCPMSENDWCHFAARVERSSLHRKIKEATLNYEDEKFCYLIFSKNKVEPCQNRVVRHPFKGAGFIKLQLCSRNNLEEKTITKKNKSSFSQARKINWGDNWSLS
jgi:ribosomal protein RSM22 (predicted rRNA methylase)